MNFSGRVKEPIPSKFITLESPNHLWSLPLPTGRTKKTCKVELNKKFTYELHMQMKKSKSHFAVIYRGYIKPGKEVDYQNAWQKVAQYYVEHRGAIGSCLH